MNNIISKLDEFLEEKEPKEKYMIYGSIVVLFIIIYYYFNYMNLSKKVEEEQIALKSIQSQYDISSYNQKLIKKRNEYFNILKQIKIIKNDLGKINNIITKTDNPELIVKKDKIFEYLRNVFKFSISKYVFPSYEINETIMNEMKLYNISFKGNTYFDNFRNVIKFLRYMEKNKFVAYIDRFEFNMSVYGKNRVSDFNGTLSIWSYK